MKYKVGDRVKMRSLQWCNENIFNNKDKYPPEIFRGIEKFCGKILMISDAVDESKYVDEGYYNMAEDAEWEYYWTDEMIEGLVEEETTNVMDENKMLIGWIKEPNRYRLVPDKDYEIKYDEKGFFYLEKKKKEYPKTYEECIGKLPINWDGKVKGYKSDLLTTFQKLIICRDVYWKIAGDEMVLGKPWKPDTCQIVYNIGRDSNRISFCNDMFGGYFILEFPTSEMRDAFYENFKSEIESCKELL